MSRKIAVIGDMHVGSPVGLFDQYKDDDGEWHHDHTEANRKLLEYWHEFWEWAETIGYDTVLLLADLCEGNNRKEFGRNLKIADLDAQTGVATRLLEPHTRGKKIYSVSGSKYHDSLDTSLDRKVTQDLGGEFHGLLSHLEIEGTGHVIQMAHGSGSGTMYRESGAAREIMFMSMAADKKLAHDVHLMIRGHLHAYHYIESEERAYLYNPGWKLFFPWAPLVKSYGKNLPTIGAVILDIDYDGIRVIKPRYRGKPFYPYFQYYDKLRGSK